MDVEQRGEPEACIRDLLAGTKGPVRVQLSSEVGVEFPVEVFDERGPGYVGPGTLGLSRELVHGLVLWHRWWEDHVDWCGSEETAGTDEEWREWSEEGDRLLARLREQLGPAFQVHRVRSVRGHSRSCDELMPAHSWPAGSRSRTVEIEGPVHVTEYGEPDAAEVVVCLHGLGGSALNFGLVAPLLAEGRRVLVPDLLGHGRSFTTAPNAPAVDWQLRMLSQLLARETERPVILVGHSMGGILAMMHAFRLPETVKGLVLLDPPVPNVTRWARDPRLTAKLAFLKMPGVAALVARQVAGMTPEQLVARQLARATPHPGRIPVEAVDATVEETRATRGADGGRGAQRAQFRAILDVVALLARPAEWRDQLAGIAAPTLWLHGTDDPLASLEAARALVASRPEWGFRAREEVGHLPHLEDPAWTVQSIEEWLDHQVKSP